MVKLKNDLQRATVWITESGVVFHRFAVCRSIRRAQISEMSEWDATTYLQRFECYVCAATAKGNNHEPLQ